MIEQIRVEERPDGRKVFFISLPASNEDFEKFINLIKEDKTKKEGE